MHSTVPLTWRNSLLAEYIITPQAVSYLGLVVLNMKKYLKFESL
jgi:hypothetical protein